MLRDDHTHMWGGDTMKSGVVMVAIVSIWNFIFMLLGLNLVLYIVGDLCILCVTLSRLICPAFLV